MTHRIEAGIWGVLALVFAGLGASCLTWKPIWFGAVFLGALAIGCGGLALAAWLSGKSRIARRVAVLGRVLFGLFLASFVLIQGMIISGEHTDDAVFDADYILVLGAHIYPTRPSAALASRLDTAADLLTQNPTAYLVLCGGQGPDEVMPEAHMMQRYLLERGVPADRLLIEDKSNNTIQNIESAIKKFNLLGEKTAVVTSEFHLARARRLMQQAGLDPHGAPAPTPYLAVRAVSHLREYCSTLGLILTGRYF